MTLRKLNFMARGRWDALGVQFKALRNQSMMVIAQIVAAIYNSAGKTCEKTFDPGEIYARLTNEEVPIEVAEADNAAQYQGSLAKLYAERKAREDAERGK